MKFKLLFKNNHMLIKLPNGHWLVDTGSTVTFGEFTHDVKSEIVEMTNGKWSPQQGVRESITYIDARTKSVQNIDARTVSSYIECNIKGIIGGDVLGHVDSRIDISKTVFETTPQMLSLPSCGIDLKEALGIPVIDIALSDGRIFPMIFDTGAQLSYFVGELPAGAIAKGNFEDFSPFAEKFVTPTHEFSIKLGKLPFSLKFGRGLPHNVVRILSQTECTGIIGNEILIDRVAYYSPRQKKLVLVKID